jgi:hypothetical protein
MFMTSRELAKRFAELVEEKKRATTRDKELSLEISEVEQKLFDAMVDEETQSIKLDNGITLYRRIDEFYGVAEGHNKEELVSALANHEQTRDLVEANYNANSLRSRIKEIKSNGEDLPEEISKLLKVHEKYRIGHRS